MNSLRLAVSFLTVFSVGPREPGPMGPARAYFPLVGLALGGILAGLDYTASLVLPPFVVGALLLIALLVLTRALHTEGFLDSCDALFGGYTRERRLEILRDPHVGAFAVIGGAALLISKWALLVSLDSELRTGLLILFPCLSRTGMLATMVVFNYARDQGLGASFKLQTRWWMDVLGLGVAVAAGVLILGLGGLVLAAVALVVALAIGRWSSRLLGGMTGDTYGAVNELAELSVLLTGVVLYAEFSWLFQAPLW